MAESMSGLLVAVVGDRDGGLWREMQGRLAHDPRFVFARRVITQPIAAGDELHQSVTPAQFEDLRRDGRLFATWSEGGRNFGLRRSLQDDLAAGRCVIVPVGAAAIAPLCDAVPHVALLRLEGGAGSGEDVPDAWRCDEDITLPVDNPARAAEAVLGLIRPRRAAQPVGTELSSKGH